MRFLVLLLVTLSGAYSFAELPGNYQSLGGAQKQELLWKKISQQPYSRLPALDLGGGPGLRQIFFSGIANSFTSPTDEIVVGRNKIIHKWGSAAKLEFVANKDHPFTGIFSTGAKAIGRMSLALPFNKDSDFVPGLALKFFVDGQPSRNVTVMEKLEGQGRDTNYFKATFTNILPDPEQFGTKVGTFAFERFVENALHLDVEHLANVTASGQTVAQPKAPYQLIFVPANGSSINSNSTDFRLDLSIIPAGTLLYEVFGRETSAANSIVYKVGSIVSTSEFVSSEYQDKTLYFQHAGTKVKSGFVVDWINGN